MMKRIGETVMIRPEGLERYAQYHAAPPPGVNEMLKACNIRNYSIFQRGELMFAYYEYVGEDFAADMKRLESDPVSQQWEALVRPLMKPFADRKDGEFWAGMNELYHLD